MGFNPKLATIQLGKPMRVGRLEMEGCKEKRRGKEINSWFLREDENEEGNSPELARLWWWLPFFTLHHGHM